MTIEDNFTQYAVNGYYISIHSPNIFPNNIEKDYFIVKSNYHYRLSYSQLNIGLLSGGFEANCAEYDIGNEHGKIRMSRDCAVHCIIEFVKVKFNSITKGLKVFMRRELSRSFGNINVNLSKYSDRSEVWDNCLQECKPDCNLKHYFARGTNQ